MSPSSVPSAFLYLSIKTDNSKIVEIYLFKATTENMTEKLLMNALSVKLI